MKFKSAALVSAAAVMMNVPAMAQDIKIGFETTLTTPAALIGKQQQTGADLAKIKAAKPDGVVVLCPGSGGPKFFTQFNQSGLNKTTPLYHIWSVGLNNLAIFQKNNINVLNTEKTAQWAPDLPSAANKKFVADFKKKYGVLPSHFAAQAYETIMLINSGVVAVNGDLSKMDAMRTALEKADFEAVRGNFKYVKNHYPTQDFYGRKVVTGADGKWTIVSTGKVLSEPAAYNANECKR